MGGSSWLAAALAGALALAGSSVALAAPVLPGNCTQEGQAVTCRYASTGAEQTFSVPTGVTSVHVTAIGGAGAGLPLAGTRGAPGGIASGVLKGLAVGSALYVEVGGNGTDSGRGGFNGGGNSTFPDSGNGGGGGGGASDVRTAARAAVDTLDTRLIVAGGGGGSGRHSILALGGFGGRAGWRGVQSSSTYMREDVAQGGGAGTAQAAGAGGTSVYGPPGEAGYRDHGGEGAPLFPPQGGDGASGGGGGGLFGGGGGAVGLVSAAGGGGGSSLVPAGGTTDVSGEAPSVTITYTAAGTTGTNPAGITATAGAGQSTPTGGAFPQPLVAIVTDPATNRPVVGAPVTFTVTSGAASFAGNTTAIAATGANGRASSPALIAGSTPGPVTVTATSPRGSGTATFTEIVTAAVPTATAVAVKGGGTLSAGGRNYSIVLDAKATATGAGTGRFALSGGGADTTAASRTITTVRRTATGAAVTGTAVTAAGNQVGFTLALADQPGGRDQVTAQIGSRTVTGSLINGDVTTD